MSPVTCEPRLGDRMRGMSDSTPRWPTSIADDTQLDELLSEPSAAAIDTMRQLDGDLIVLGVAGKMGPTLARMARRASDAAGVRRRVIGVARFSDPTHEAALQAHGVETIRCDLLDQAAVDRLPDAPLVVYMAGRKFGSTGLESLTWAMNAWLPAIVCRRYAGSRIAAFSTGNVYGLSPVGRGGSREEDAVAPVGEYAMSCLARERMFEHFSRTNGTPVSILRLNYATEMRYGLLVDLARKVAAGTPVELAMGHGNVIWQGDANAMSLVALRHASSPPYVVNIAGREELSVRSVCLALGARLGRDVQFTGAEAGDALLSNGSRGWTDLGSPQVDLSRLIDWTADWISRGGASLGKPTHFESRDGRF
jgi:nucleoside-diphosphate-sugar epimerase